MNLLAVLCLCLGGTAMAQEPMPLRLVPQIDQTGVTSRVTEFDLTTLTQEALDKQAAEVSRRVGYGKPPLVFRTNYEHQGRLAIRLAKASVGGATFRVSLRDLIYELTWPPAGATHQVGVTYFLPLPPGPNEITVAAPSGVVVIDRYDFYPTDKPVADEVMLPMPSGEGNAWQAPQQTTEAAELTAPLRERAAGFDAAHGAFGWPYNLSPHDSGMAIEDVWPSIYFGKERLPEIRRKIDSLPWAKAAFEQMLREAEAVLKTEPVQPIERVGWRHDFYSRKSGEHLVYDPASPDLFLDPWFGGFENDPAQHRAWVLFTHERTHRLMHSLALLYGLTGDERYAQWVADGMRRAVEMFKHRELREGNNSEALYFQPLYDAPALMMLCDSYDLTKASAAYTAEDHAAIKAGIFEEGIPYQIRFQDKAGVHNMSCFVSPALVMAGLEFGHDEWVQRGLRDERNGLRTLLTGGVRSDEATGEVDGFWFEGTMFYHHYSLCPLVTLWEIDKRLGDGTTKDPEVARRFEEMLAAPVKLADQFLRLPTVGDLGAPKFMSVRQYRHLYEYAAGQVNPERFGTTLAACYADGTPRNSWAALAFGPDALPAARTPAGDDLLKRPGMGVLRRTVPLGGTDEPWYLLFKAGPHGAGHDHQDKLEIAFNALGQVIAPDIGTAGYALTSIHPFYRSTFSHSTLFVDEKDQASVKDASLEWKPEASPAYGHGTVRDAYPGVVLDRKVWFDAPYIVVADTLTSEEEHRFGMLFHAYGSLHGSVSKAMPAPVELPKIPRLEPHLTGTQSAWTEGEMEADWRVCQGVWLRLVSTSDGPFEATIGRTPGNPMPDSRGTVMLRAVGKTRRFWSVFEVHRGSPTLSSVEVEGDGLSITLRDGALRRYAPM
jgi:hypothetical protein